MAVYFIRSGDHIKIGKSDNPWKRLATLQTGNPATLQMLAIAPGSVDFEAGLQEAFGSDCERGEWYKPTERLMAFISSIRVTFPHLQNPPQVNLHQPPAVSTNTEEPLLRDSPIIALGESLTFRLTHKGQFRYPRDPLNLWQVVMIYLGGYFKGYENDEWRTAYAPGLRFHFENEQYFTVTRVGEVSTAPGGSMDRNHSLDRLLGDALKNAIYNRKNTAGWLGVYNDDSRGIAIAISRKPIEGKMRLDVPEEVIAHWRQYQYKSPLAAGVSIEA